MGQFSPLLQHSHLHTRPVARCPCGYNHPSNSREPQPPTPATPTPAPPGSPSRTPPPTPPTTTTMAESKPPRPISAESIAKLSNDGANRAQWAIGIRAACIQAGCDDTLTTVLTATATENEWAIERNVYGLLLRTIDHALADTILRECTTVTTA